MTTLASIKELYVYRELLWVWTWRGIKARYKQSIFGFAWAVFQPLALSATFVVAFSYIVRLPSDGIPYPIFVYSAMLPWSFFTRAISAAVISIVGNKNLVTKVYFPRAIFPLSAVATSFVDFLAGLLIFAGLMFYYQVPLTGAMGMLPVLFLIQLLLTAGIALGTAAINVFYRDVNQMVPLLLQLWMYACPIIYPLSIVPERLRSWYVLNPMAVVIHAYRQVVLKGTLPEGPMVRLALLVSLAVFLGGYLIFKQLEDRFVDII